MSESEIGRGRIRIALYADLKASNTQTKFIFWLGQPYFYSYGKSTKGMITVA